MHPFAWAFPRGNGIYRVYEATGRAPAGGRCEQYVVALPSRLGAIAATATVAATVPTGHGNW
jgi:hypothetical protein